VNCFSAQVDISCSATIQRNAHYSLQCISFISSVSFYGAKKSNPMAVVSMLLYFLECKMSSVLFEKNDPSALLMGEFISSMISKHGELLQPSPWISSVGWNWIFQAQSIHSQGRTVMDLYCRVRHQCIVCDHPIHPCLHYQSMCTHSQ
jgi:hypothetical protein